MQIIRVGLARDRERARDPDRDPDRGRERAGNAPGTARERLENATRTARERPENATRTARERPENVLTLAPSPYQGLRKSAIFTPMHRPVPLRFCAIAGKGVRVAFSGRSRSVLGPFSGRSRLVPGRGLGLGYGHGLGFGFGRGAGAASPPLGSTILQPSDLCYIDSHPWPCLHGRHTSRPGTPYPWQGHPWPCLHSRRTSRPGTPQPWQGHPWPCLHGRRQHVTSDQIILNGYSRTHSQSESPAFAGFAQIYR
jgi:hypothetical protein